ncbi:DUF3829 domain-containing protein [Proteus hauseri]|uniref:DUF3829 domain-containing protein n=1 Tax=Proteus hauseri TaxID=183417 RepID=UPI0032DA08A0
MKKSILVSVLGVLLISAAGCDNANENPNSELSQQDKTKIEQSKSDQTSIQTDEIQFSQKIEKGNLWLSAFNEEFGPILKKKTSVLSATISSDLLNNTKKTLAELSSDKNMTLDLSPFKVLETETDQIKRMQANSKLMSVNTVFSTYLGESGLNRAKEAFEYMNTLTPALPELDAVGSDYGKSYTDLYEKMLKLGDYLFIKETYRLDDYAQANALYDDVKNAYTKLLEEKEKAVDAYENYYQIMHIEELQLVKKKGLIIRFHIMESLDTVSNSLDLINPDKLDLNVLADVITKVEAQSVVLEKAFNDEALMKKENMKISDSSTGAYLKTYQQLLIELKVLEKKAKENKDITSSLNTISNNYESLIRDYNYLISK